MRTFYYLNREFSFKAEEGLPIWNRFEILIGVKIKLFYEYNLNPAYYINALLAIHIILATTLDISNFTVPILIHAENVTQRD